MVTFGLFPGFPHVAKYYIHHFVVVPIHFQILPVSSRTVPFLVDVALFEFLQRIFCYRCFGEHLRTARSTAVGIAQEGNDLRLDVWGGEVTLECGNAFRWLSGEEVHA